MIQLSVIIPTHQPHAGRLRRTLAGLRAQTLPTDQWETLLVDNASTPALDGRDYETDAPANLRCIQEPVLGLTAARRSGIIAARAAILVLVDDDNVLAPDYLARVLELFAAHPRVGALGGRSVPEFEVSPAEWMREFDDLIACRDLGPKAQISTGLRPKDAERNHYPVFAPIGAGMSLRREASAPWLNDRTSGQLTDRRGGSLTSGGDNDIILHAMRAGWEVAYFPQLSLTHLIPASRSETDYLARLYRGIATSWMKVLTKHDANPWPLIPAWTIPFRKVKAWFSYRGWDGSAGYVRWQGACGHFEGRRKP